MTDLSEIFSRTSDAVFAIDDSCRIVYRNKNFSRFFPCPTSGGTDRHCYEVVCGKTLDGRAFCNPDCPIGKSLTSGHLVENFDLIVPQPEGEPLWFCVGAFPLSPSCNAAAVCMLRPISAYKALARLAEMKLSKENPPPASSLTRREREILSLLAAGCGTKKLARKLHISHVTARNHICHIFEKLDVHSRAEAVIYAYRHSLL